MLTSPSGLNQALETRTIDLVGIATDFVAQFMLDKQKDSNNTDCHTYG